MSRPIVPSFAPTAAERVAEQEAQQAAWRRLFQPIDNTFFDVDQPWLVQNWIPLGTLAILASPPKQGKTAIATALALAVATGTPFAGMPTNQGGVLWLAQEESAWDRQRLLRLSPHTDPLVPLLTTHERMPVDRQETLDALAFMVQENDVRLIVVDPLHGATSGRSLNDGWQARRTLDPLRSFCHGHGVTALVLHHSKRAATPSGYLRVAENDQLAATAGMTMVLSSRLLQMAPEPQSPQESSPRRLVTLECSGRGPHTNRRVQFLSSGPLDYALDETLPPDVSEPSLRVTYASTIRDLLARQGPLSSGQMLAELGLPENSLRVALARLVRTGGLKITSQLDGTRVYEVTKTANEELMPC